MTFDGGLMRGTGFREVPARFGPSPAQLTSVAFSFAAFDMSLVALKAIKSRFSGFLTWERDLVVGNCLDAWYARPL